MIDTPGSLPRDGAPDATLAFLSEGYRFVSNRCDRLGTDAFTTRLMLRRAVCLRGPRAVALLYGAAGTTRKGALPVTALKLLQDRGSVQQLEGEAHRDRKALFLRLLGPDTAALLAQQFRADWRADLSGRRRVEVLATASDRLARIACDWAGLPEDFGGDVRFRRGLVRMSAEAGRLGPGMAATLLRRSRMEAALRDLVRETRARRERAASPLDRLIAARGADGHTLPDAAVAVELLNLLRPIAAVGRYVAFAAQRLILHPAWREVLAATDAPLVPFCEEVRRISPFFPVTAAITTRPVRAAGLDLPEGQWLIGDLWGTLQDPDIFPEPGAFRPERGLDHRGDTALFVPQGGGDPARTHRCPGEGVTVALMAAALRVLCRDLDWTVPDQDLSVDLSRIPARPASGVLLDRLRPR